MIELCTDGSATITVAGEIDLATASAITDQVAAALDGAPSAVALHMGDVTFIGSTGMNALVAARRACDARGVPFAIVDPSPRVVRMLQLTGLDLGFDIRTGPAGAPQPG